MRDEQINSLSSTRVVECYQNLLLDASVAQLTPFKNLLRIVFGE